MSVAYVNTSPFRKLALALLIGVSLLSSCSIENEGEIDLGSNLHYLPGPAFNAIVLSVNNQAFDNRQLIPGIEAIGFNHHYIMAVSNIGRQEYWYIDKWGIKDVAVEDINRKIKKIDEAIFKRMISENGIRLKTKQDYRVTLEYNR